MASSALSVEAPAAETFDFLRLADEGRFSLTTGTCSASSSLLVLCVLLAAESDAVRPFPGGHDALEEESLLCTDLNPWRLEGVEVRMARVALRVCEQLGQPARLTGRENMPLRGRGEEGQRT